MKVSRKDLEWAASEGVISGGQAEDLWRAFEWRASGRPRFDLAHVAYYFGAVVVISAMGWFMTLGWERFGGGEFWRSRWYMLPASLSRAICCGAGGISGRRGYDDVARIGTLHL
jgi:hypothetical protein